MVYGRYNELVNGVYKPTNITGGHHPVGKLVGKVEGESWGEGCWEGWKLTSRLQYL